MVYKAPQTQIFWVGGQKYQGGWLFSLYTVYISLKTQLSVLKFNLSGEIFAGSLVLKHSHFEFFGNRVGDASESVEAVGVLILEVSSLFGETFGMQYQVSLKDTNPNNASV